MGTNTRMTDAEILEKRYPVLVRSFGLRRDQSGGLGAFEGGQGLERTLEFLKSMTVSILSERRVLHPFGLAGGQDGKCGKNTWITSGGRRINIGGKNTIQVQA